MSEDLPLSVYYDKTVVLEGWEQLGSKELPRSLLVKLGRKALDLVVISKLLPKQYANSHTNRAREDKRVEENIRDRAEARLNEVLMSVNDLNAALENGDESIARRGIKLDDGGSQTVYDLNGFNFRYLQHVVGFIGRDSGIGKQIIGDPSVWLKNKEQFIVNNRLIGEPSSDLSLSYMDTKQNLRLSEVVRFDKRTPLVYGYSSKPGGHLKSWGNDDLMTRTYPENIRIPRDREDIDRRLVSKLRDDVFNEVVGERYDEDGAPSSPDFMIAYDGVITDATKKHAEFFGVPIININTEFY